LGLFAYFVGMLGTLAMIVGGLMCIVVALAERRRSCSLRVPTGMLCGYIAGVMFVWWSLVPRDWALPFWTTLAATTQAEKYGHPVEHYAEGIVTAMMFCGVLGAAIGRSVMHLSGMRLGRRKVGQER
jgi:hypothetical protein